MSATPAKKHTLAAKGTLKRSDSMYCALCDKHVITSNSERHLKSDVHVAAVIKASRVVRK